MTSPDKPLHIDISVKLDDVKAVFSIETLAFQGDLPASIIHLHAITSEARTREGFAKVAVDRETGTVVWPGGADLAPDTLYVRAQTGAWPGNSIAAWRHVSHLVSAPRSPGRCEATCSCRYESRYWEVRFGRARLVTKSR